MTAATVATPAIEIAATSAATSAAAAAATAATGAAAAASTAAEKQLGCTCFKLRKLARAVSRLYDQHLATVGLKTTQYSVLANAARAAVPVALLAERLGIERTTLTRNLVPLVDAGWIVLRPGADSRQRVVTLTAAGLAKVTSAYPAWRAAQADIEQLLGRDTVRGLNTQLDQTLLQLTPRIEELNHVHPS